MSAGSNSVRVAVVVVAGQARKVGKTSLAAAIIASFPERRWTAVKIAQCHHDSRTCHCELAGASFACTEEHESGPRTDTSRFLAAGAVRAYWLRTRPEGWELLLPTLREIIAAGGDTLIESGTSLGYVHADIVLAVAGPEGIGSKGSWPRTLASADALVYPAQSILERSDLPAFPMTTDCICSAGLRAFVDSRLSAVSA